MAIDITPSNNFEKHEAIDITPKDSGFLDISTGAPRAFLEHLNDQLYLGASGEIRGGFDTAIDAIKGRLPDSGNGLMSDIAQDYRTNRDFYESQLADYSGEHP